MNEDDSLTDRMLSESATSKRHRVAGASACASNVLVIQTSGMLCTDSKKNTRRSWFIPESTDSWRYGVASSEIKRAFTG